MRKWAAVWFPACLVWGLPLWVGAEPAVRELTSAQYQLIERSIRAASSGGWDEVATLMEEAIGLGDHPALQRRLGEARLRQGRCAQARAHLERAEYHDPWVMPGKDAEERERRALLDELEKTCPGQLRLWCEEGTRVFVEERAASCGEPMRLTPGEYVLTGQDLWGGPLQPRRVHVRGEAVTELRLQGPEGEQVRYHWVPSSVQRVPEQDPLRESYEEGLVLIGVLGGIGLLLGSLGGTLLWLTYEGGNPSEEPRDPSLDEEEQEQAELDYIAGLSYGWMGVVTGGAMILLGVLLWPEAPPSSGAPGFSGRGLQWGPWVGEGWGLGVEGRF